MVRAAGRAARARMAVVGLRPVGGRAWAGW